MVAPKGVVEREKGRKALDALALGGKNVPSALSFAYAEGDTTNETEVTISVTDIDGNALAGVWALDVWVSDAATGLGLTATTASGTVAAKSASTGVDLGVLTAKKATRVTTNASGAYTVAIVDTAYTGFYVAASIPSLGIAAISRQLVTGDYSTTTTTTTTTAA